MKIVGKDAQLRGGDRPADVPPKAPVIAAPGPMSKDALTLSRVSPSRTFPAPVPLEKLRDNGEASYFQATGKAQLVPLAPFHPKGKVVIFVHGIFADPLIESPLIDDALKRGNQVWVLAYQSVGRTVTEDGADFAEQLEKLAAERGVRDVTVVGHSLGGMLTKAALDLLTLPDGKLEGLDHLRFVALAVPWGGFKSSLVDALTPKGAELGRDLAAMAPDNPRWRNVVLAAKPANVTFDNLAADTDEVVYMTGTSPAVRALQHAMARQADFDATVRAAGHMSLLDTSEALNAVRGDLSALPPSRPSTFLDHLEGLTHESLAALDLAGTILIRRGLSASPDPLPFEFGEDRQGIEALLATAPVLSPAQDKVVQSLLGSMESMARQADAPMTRAAGLRTLGLLKPKIAAHRTAPRS